MKDWPAEVAPTLDAHYGEKQGLDDQHIRSGGVSSLPAVSMCLNAGGMGRLDAESETLIPTIGGVFDVAHDVHCADVSPTLRAGNYKDNSNPLTHNNGSTAVPAIAFSCNDHGADTTRKLAPTMRAMGHSGSHANAGHQLAVAFQSSQSGVRLDQVHATLDSNNGPRRHNGALVGMQVRRLTPRECERLQAFPDDHTAIRQGNGKPAADGPRYKALGNSMCVLVMRWIGYQIDFAYHWFPSASPANDTHFMEADLFA